MERSVEKVEPLLVVEHFSVQYQRMDRPAVDDVSLSLNPGQVLGVVGESGCGKTTLIKGILGFFPHCVAGVAGSVRLEGKELLGLPDKERRNLLGTSMDVIAQDSGTSLNPMKRIGKQFSQILGEKLGLSYQSSMIYARELLARVNCPKELLNRFPFQLSGGQRQRVLIALAFALRPKLLLADEPTSALDVTVQGQVLRELELLRRDCKSAILLISHNLGAVSRIADQVAVMYQGQVVEYGETHQVMDTPSHPYTKGLIACVPSLSLPKSQRLYNIPQGGKEWEGGCRFASRCPERIPDCQRQAPQLRPGKKGGLVACHCCG